MRNFVLLPFLMFLILSCSYKSTVIKGGKKNLIERSKVLKELNLRDIQKNIYTKYENEIRNRKEERNYREIYTKKFKKSYQTFLQKKKRGDISIHLENVNIKEFLDEVAYKILNISYLAVGDLKGSVTIHVDDITKEDLINVVTEVLNSLGYLAFVEDGVLKIFPSKKSLHAKNVVIYSPKYVSVNTLKQVVREVFKDSVKIFVTNNSIILAGDDITLHKGLSLIKVIDKPFYSDKYLSFIRVSSSSKKVKEALDKVLSLLGKDKSLYIIESLDEFNTIVVVTKDGYLLNEIKNWVELLENNTYSVETKVYTIRLNYIDAEKAAEIIRSIFSDFVPLSKESKETKKSIEPVSVTEKEKNVLKEKEGKKTKEVKIPEITNTIEKSPKQVTENFTVKVIPYENALIIKATPLQFNLIKSLLKEIDNIPQQVLIEAVVAEVSLGKNLKYGFEGIIKALLDSYKLNVETNFGLRGSANSLTGFKAIFLNQNADINAILNILSSKTNLRVLSSPYILVKDNTEARIEIGAEVPVVTEQMTTTSGGTPVITTAVQYRPTGIILRVKPKINRDTKTITLELVEEVSDALPNTISPQVNSPIITKRSATTTLLLHDGQLALIGGMIQHRFESQETGVPGLKDIPGLGLLFKTKNKGTSSSELLILIKASIISSTNELTDFRREIIKNLEKLKEVLSNKHGKN